MTRDTAALSCHNFIQYFTIWRQNGGSLLFQHFTHHCVCFMIIQRENIVLNKAIFQTETFDLILAAKVHRSNSSNRVSIRQQLFYIQQAATLIKAHWSALARRVPPDRRQQCWNSKIIRPTTCVRGQLAKVNSRPLHWVLWRRCGRNPLLRSKVSHRRDVIVASIFAAERAEGGARWAAVWRRRRHPSTAWRTPCQEYLQKAALTNASRVTNAITNSQMK